MLYKAKVSFARCPSSKMEWVADLVRGQNINRALEVLKAVPNKGATILNKLLRSAVSNAQHLNEEVDVDLLTIKELMLGSGAAFKRIRYGPQGRVRPILKRTCHVSVVLEAAPEAEGEEGEGKKRKRRTLVQRIKEKTAPTAGGAKPAAAPRESKPAKKEPPVTK